jgi:hypothetical protein
LIFLGLSFGKAVYSFLEELVNVIMSVVKPAGFSLAPVQGIPSFERGVEARREINLGGFLQNQRHLLLDYTLEGIGF